MEALREVTLETVGGGAALELFERELRDVLKNIQDPNTDAEATRSIALTVSFSPHEDRESAGIAVAAKTKLAPARPHVSHVYIGQKDGRLLAVEHDPRQSDLFRDDGSVRPIHHRPADVG